MTVGKDVSALFPDVVNCMQTDNLELKKLVYLYLMNYAKSQPDMAIMAVNTFVKVRVFFFLSFIVKRKLPHDRKIHVELALKLSMPGRPNVKYSKSPLIWIN